MTIYRIACDRCGPAPVKGRLLDTLLALAHGEGPTCRQCGGAAELRATFAFGLEAADPACTILAAYAPSEPEAWRKRDGAEVIYYPLLVILRRHGRADAAWLPYWHVVKHRDGRRESKYGERAPFMDVRLFDDLLAQARADGWLV